MSLDVNITEMDEFFFLKKASKQEAIDHNFGGYDVSSSSAFQESAVLLLYIQLNILTSYTMSNN